MAGTSFVCSVNNVTEYGALPASGCEKQCIATLTPASNSRGVSLIGTGGKYFLKYTWTDEVCEGASFCDSQIPSTSNNGEPGVEPGGTYDLGEDGSLSDDGSSGSYPGGTFNEPPPGGCSYSDDGVLSCDDESGGNMEDGDGEVGTDNNGDGTPDDGYSFADHFGGNVAPGTTIVDPDTGGVLGTAVDEDGDGITDGIDSDGDGDMDIDDPTDYGGGQDNNGDGVVNDSDGDNNGDGVSGGAGDCIDDPATEANECAGTGDEPGGASVAGLDCTESPACQPAEEDVQGALWCAQLQLQHKVSCQYYVPEAENSPDSLLADKEEDSGEFLWQETDLAEDGPQLSGGVVVAAGACFEDIVIPLLGRNYTIPLSELCWLFSAIGLMVVLSAYMTAGFIVYKGGLV